MEDLSITIGGEECIDQLRELWLALHHHHRQVSSLQPLVDCDERSWDRRSRLYHKELSDDGGLLAIATKTSRPVGYAMVVLREGPDDTWPVGDRYAELYSLSVASDERGRGIGSALFDAVERELAAREIRDLSVAVMAGNTAAIRFYERRGLRLGEILLYRFDQRP